jgi:pimeloyl-ACP methyl ester carboxylesterase
MTIALHIHSTGLGPTMWLAATEGVATQLRVVAPANLGYPPAAPVSRGVEIHIADEVKNLTAALPAGFEAVHVIAHSYGATVALALAAELGAKVRSMFLVEPVVFGALSRARGQADDAAVTEAEAFTNHPWFLHDPERGGSDAWLEVFIDYWNRPGSWARLPPRQQDALRAVGWKMFQEVRACFYAVESFDACRLPDVPVTLLVGRKSPSGARAMTTQIAALNPHAHVVEIDAGHMSPVTHAPLVRAALLHHMERAA